MKQIQCSSLFFNPLIQIKTRWISFTCSINHSLGFPNNLSSILTLIKCPNFCFFKKFMHTQRGLSKGLDKALLKISTVYDFSVKAHMLINALYIHNLSSLKKVNLILYNNGPTIGRLDKFCVLLFVPIFSEDFCLTPNIISSYPE